MNSCYFCKYKQEPSFRNPDELVKFLSPRKKLVGKDRTALCAKHQRKLTKQIKYARYLAIIPYISYQGTR